MPGVSFVCTAGVLYSGCITSAVYCALGASPLRVYCALGASPLWVYCALGASSLQVYCALGASPLRVYCALGAAPLRVYNCVPSGQVATLQTGAWFGSNDGWLHRYLHVHSPWSPCSAAGTLSQ